MADLIKILYVDDEPINLMLFERIFGKKYNIMTAESGLSGMKILSENLDIRIVISDMRMPLMDGLEFTKKAKENFPGIIFFILTGFGITEPIMEALDINLIDRYFQKPYQMEEINNAIKTAIERSEQL
jgi:two-component system, response regulator, stage 0 sporulation protein F